MSSYCCSCLKLSAGRACGERGHSHMQTGERAGRQAGRQAGLLAGRQAGSKAHRCCLWRQRGPVHPAAWKALSPSCTQSSTVGRTGHGSAGQARASTGVGWGWLAQNCHWCRLQATSSVLSSRLARKIHNMPYASMGLPPPQLCMPTLPSGSQIPFIPSLADVHASATVGKEVGGIRPGPALGPRVDPCGPTRALSPAPYLPAASLSNHAATQPTPSKAVSFPTLTGLRRVPGDPSAGVHWVGRSCGAHIPCERVALAGRIAREVEAARRDSKRARAGRGGGGGLGHLSIPMGLCLSSGGRLARGVLQEGFRKIQDCRFSRGGVLRIYNSAPSPRP